MKIALLFLAGGLVLSVSVQSEEKVDCSKTTNTLEINQCLSGELKVADRQLNETYREFLNTLEKMEEFGKMPKGLLVEGLRRAQREWITFRDRNCEFYSNLMYGGTAASTYYVSCQARMTKERLAELKTEAEFWKSKGY